MSNSIFQKINNGFNCLNFNYQHHLSSYRGKIIIFIIRSLLYNIKMTWLVVKTNFNHSLELKEQNVSLIKQLFKVFFKQASIPRDTCYCYLSFETDKNCWVTLGQLAYCQLTQCIPTDYVAPAPQKPYLNIFNTHIQLTPLPP